MRKANLWQWRSVVRGVDFWTEIELWSQETLIRNITGKVLSGLGIVPSITFEVLVRLLIMFAELLQYT